MLERNIKLYEPAELIIFLTFSGMYYLGVSEKYNFFERFDYDINVFIVISVICFVRDVVTLVTTEEVEVGVL